MPDSNTIKVLLVDDQPLVREGWRKALKTAVDIEIIGEKPLCEILAGVEGTIPPEIIILRAQVLEKTKNREAINILKASKHPIKVIAVATNIDEIPKAQKAGADEANVAPFSRQEFIHLIRGLNRDDSSLCAHYVKQLKTLQPNLQDMHAYEDLVYGALQLLFYPMLTNPQLNRHSYRGRHDSTIIFQNIASEGFWSAIRSNCQADYVLFQLNNAPDVKPTQLQRLEASLSKSIGHFGVLLTRYTDKPSLRMIQRSIYQNHEKVILIIGDNHLHEMLALKAARAYPSEVFDDLYVEFINLVSDSAERIT